MVAGFQKALGGEAGQLLLLRLPARAAVSPACCLCCMAERWPSPEVCCQKQELASGTQGGFFCAYKYVFCSPCERRSFLWANLSTVSFYTLNPTCTSILFIKAFAEEPREDGYVIFHLLLFTRENTVSNLCLQTH